MNKPESPEVLAVVPLPTAQERRRRQIMLSRLLLAAVDMTLAGEPLGLETARDLIREVEHTYPELAAEWIENE
jgi:hypothetical protein